MSGRSRQRDNAKNAPGQLGGSDTPRPPRSVPIPAALDGRRYTIRDSGGRTQPAYVARDDTTGVMQVPLGPDASERRTRLHEMAHVRWTPAGKPHTTAAHETMNAVEDCRIHKRLKEVGLDLARTAPLWGPEEQQMVTDRFHQQSDPDSKTRPFPPLEVARMLAACIGTVEERFYRRVAESYGHGWILAAVDEMHGRHFGKRRPAFKRTIEFAEEMEAAFGDLDETIPADVQERLMQYDESDRGSKWGTMEVLEMPLTVRLPRGLRTRVKRSSESGAVPRNWHRLPIDQRVFSVRRYKPGGGTVLLDQSGSMALSMDAVQAIMSRFPAVTIATYAGRGGRGQLRIIARNGQRASDEECVHPMNGNIIDGPALDWLNEQPGPRVWVSDGMVTGADESMAPSLLVDAARKVQAGKVQRVDRLEALLEE